MSIRALDRYDPMDPALREDPFAYYAALREHAPVHHASGLDAYLISRHADVKAVVSDPATFSSQVGPITVAPPPEALAVLADAMPPVHTLLTADPPEHRRYRTLVARAFAPRRVARLESTIRELAHGLVDRMEGEGRVDLVERFAVPLPLTMIADQLGVPRRDLPDLKRWSDDNVALLGGMLDAERFVGVARSLVEFQRYFVARIEECRAAPRDDILSQLLRAEVDERPLDGPELVSILNQFMVAGNETTTNALSAGVRLLLEHPEQRAAVEADPGLWPSVVEEVLRLASPVATLFRAARREHTLHGVRIPAGARLAVVYASANRDPAVFRDPDRFDPTRPELGEHLAFGFGEHYCVGAGLARKEIEIGLQVLLERLPRLRLCPDADLAHHPSFILRGLRSLHVAFD